MNLIIPNNLKYISSKDYAYQVLLANITQWNLLPGEVLKDSEISKLLGISRTPVREAINSLREDMLIDVGSVTRVSLIDPKMILEGLYIRTAVESMIGAELCGTLTPEHKGILRENLERQRLLTEGNIGKKNFFELDDEFHKLLYEFAGREFSHRIAATACRQLNRNRYWAFLRTGIDTAAIYHLHCSIYYAIVEGRREDAVKLCREHCYITHVKYHSPEVSKTLLTQHPEYFTDPKAMAELDSKFAKLMSEY